MKDLLDERGNFVSWDTFSNKYNIQQNKLFKWIQLKNCIPKTWLKLVRIDILQENICDFKPHINIKSRICSINKLSSADIYKLLIKRIEKPPTSQSFFNEKFDISHMWKNIYLLPRYATVDTYSRIFQYKILNNILFLNEKLFHLHLVDSPLCSLCGLAKENVKHLFFECPTSKSLWNSLQNHLINHLPLNDLTLQSAVFLFFKEPEDNTNITNHILLIFKIFLFKNRTHKPTLISLLARIKNIANIEGHLCFTDKQWNRHNKKWGKIINLF